MPTLSKTAQVLKYFAQQYASSGIPRKRLVKAAYMTDVLARQYLGRAITDFAYIKDHYGPNAPELAGYTEELTSSSLATEQRSRDGDLTWIRLRDTGKPTTFDFSLGESEILGYVAANYLEMDIAEFIEDVVKNTDPYKAAAAHGESLPMDLVNNTAKREVGFDLERVALAEKNAEEGRFATLTQFADALRAQASSRHPD